MLNSLSCSCFLSPGYGTIWAFGAPALAVIAVSLIALLLTVYIYELQIYFYCDTIQINVVFLVMALVQLYRTQKGTESRGSSNTASIK